MKAICSSEKRKGVSSNLGKRRAKVTPVAGTWKKERILDTFDKSNRKKSKENIKEFRIATFSKANDPEC
jgi:hypothetical protein